MASQNPLVKINTKVLAEILGPKYRDAVGALPLPEAVEHIATTIENTASALVEKELTTPKIKGYHRTFMKDVFPKLNGGKAG